MLVLEVSWSAYNFGFQFSLGSTPSSESDTHTRTHFFPKGIGFAAPELQGSKQIRSLSDLSIQIADRICRHNFEIYVDPENRQPWRPRIRLPQLPQIISETCGHEVSLSSHQWVTSAKDTETSFATCDRHMTVTWPWRDLWLAVVLLNALPFRIQVDWPKDCTNSANTCKYRLTDGVPEMFLQ